MIAREMNLAVGGSIRMVGEIEEETVGGRSRRKREARHSRPRCRRQFHCRAGIEPNFVAAR